MMNKMLISVVFTPILFFTSFCYADYCTKELCSGVAFDTNMKTRGIVSSIPENYSYVATSEGVFKSVDGEVSWQEVNRGLPLKNRMVEYLSLSANYVCVGVVNEGFFKRRAINGNSWAKVKDLNDFKSTCGINSDTYLKFINRYVKTTSQKK